nr:MAG TPA: hypothetical protein [Caudoviricetes sp.]
MQGQKKVLPLRCQNETSITIKKINHYEYIRIKRPQSR